MSLGSRHEREFGDKMFNRGEGGMMSLRDWRSRRQAWVRKASGDGADLTPAEEKRGGGAGWGKVAGGKFSTSPNRNLS